MKTKNSFMSSFKKLRGLTVILILACCIGQMEAKATSVTYTVTSTTAVSTSGTAPSGSSASYSQTYGTAKQATKNNSFTLTISGWNGCSINITLSMRSNSSGGAGSLKDSTDGGSTYNDIISGDKFNTSSWYGSWGTSYVDISKDVSISPTSSNFVIMIEATANSLYCESYTITYTSSGGGGGASDYTLG